MSATRFTCTYCSHVFSARQGENRRLPTGTVRCFNRKTLFVPAVEADPYFSYTEEQGKAKKFKPRASNVAPERVGADRYISHVETAGKVKEANPSVSIEPPWYKDPILRFCWIIPVVVFVPFSIYLSRGAIYYSGTQFTAFFGYFSEHEIWLLVWFILVPLCAVALLLGVLYAVNARAEQCALNVGAIGCGACILITLLGGYMRNEFLTKMGMLGLVLFFFWRDD
jgi:hypothetical protein